MVETLVGGEVGGEMEVVDVLAGVGKGAVGEDFVGPAEVEGGFVVGEGAEVVLDGLPGGVGDGGGVLPEGVPGVAVGGDFADFGIDPGEFAIPSNSAEELFGLEGEGGEEK